MEIPPDPPFPKGGIGGGHSLTEGLLHVVEIIVTRQTVAKKAQCKSLFEKGGFRGILIFDILF
jgi:hypothetical protein